MPNLIIPIPNTLDSVTRKVAKSVINNVMRITNIAASTRVEIRGEQGSAAQPGSELEDNGIINRYAHDGKVVVSFRETYVDSEIINSEVRHPYAQPIFSDPDIGVMIKPIYSNTEMELNFTYRTTSKQEAMIWRDDVKVRMADNRQSHLHEVDYHFPVPGFCSRLLMQIHERRESVAGYGDSLGEYLKKHYTRRATVLVKQDGDLDNSLLVIGEKQLGVQGWFDFDLPVEEEKNEEGPSYLIQFNYKFSYHKPVEVNVVYPQVVHNQLISPDFIVMRPRTEDPLSLPTYKSDYRFALDNFDYLARIPQRQLGGISIPDFDEWIPSQIVPYTTTFISFMVVFEPKDLNLVLGSKDIQDVGFDQLLMPYMQAFGKKMVALGQCPIHFSLFRGLEPISDGDLDVVVTEHAFEIKTKTPADLRQTYHLRMGFCTELSKYTDEALMSLHHNGFVALKLFQSVVNRLDVEDAQLNHMTEDGKLSIEYIKRFFAYLRNQRVGATGTSIHNSHENEDSWFKNNDNFNYRMDTPYVEILTIISLNRNRGQ
ncbi:hypothetical protein D3C85_14950 [compost metagenome]